MNVPCPHCGTPLKVNDKFAGRKALCSHCEQNFVIPAAVPAGVAAVAGTGPPKDGGSGIRRSALPTPRHSGGPDDPRRYLKVAAEKGYLNGAMVGKCLGAFERQAGRGEEALTIGEFLVERGYLTPEENRSVILLINRTRILTESQKRTAADIAAAAEARECPNCFETIRANSKSCRYCGAFLGELEISDQCPNCFATQPPGEKFCKGCGANMKTGLIGDQTRRRCPKCGILSSGMETICVVCKTAFDKPKSAVQAQEAAGKLWQKLYDNRGFIILGVLVLAAFWLFRNRDEVGDRAAGVLQGEDRAAAGKRVGEFAEAVQHRNFELLGKMMWVGGRPLRTDEARKNWTKITGGESADDAVESLQTEIKPSENAYYVYVDLVLRPAAGAGTPGTGLPEGIDPGGLPGLGGPAAPKTRTLKLTWKWKKFGNDWYYVEPVL